eukprot:m.98390 g.98390  ORF g.98390 m.98390 type:complete len:257 (+) comp13633_c0_seq1:4022-4792(+)
MPKVEECQYCTATGPWTRKKCENCDVRWCTACYQGDAGIMLSYSKRGNKVLKCANCGSNPNVARKRGDWQGSDSRNSKLQGPGGNEFWKKKVPPTERANDVMLETLRSPKYKDETKSETNNSRSRTPTFYERMEPEQNIYDRLSNPKHFPLSTHLRFQPNEESNRQQHTRNNPPSRTQRKSRPDASVFDRLNDPQRFTGTHKHRFSKDGHGLGLDGRRDGKDAMGTLIKGEGKIIRDAEAEMDFPNRPLSRFSDTY